MPGFRFDKISDVAREAKAILKPKDDGSREAATGVKQRADQARNPNAGRRTPGQRKRIRRERREFSRAQREKIKSKKRELSRIKKDIRTATEQAETIKHKKRKKTVQQEIFELERELRAARERRAEDGPGTGALPDFIVIGAMKSGTTFLYYLLGQHPLVEPAAKKELHFFDAHFDLGVEWYRRCFPQPRWEEDRSTITGEATPYMSHPLAPERMARVVPDARLIALLRNPVERAFSHHQQLTRKQKESRTLEEAMEADHDGLMREYLSKGVYVDQLLRWSEYFDKEQLLVLKSEDFFENPQDTLKLVLEFLGLPEWEPASSELDTRRNVGRYEGEMDSATRRRLEEYFAPHNKRLYDFLGTDFGW